ncbi:hypothetical protein CF326_g8849 [Tilletia indica]|nr:hypothetical protein CF326_g8849 [Tilletia indica]
MPVSVHQLLHVADQMLAIGSVKATSQASCERYFGFIKKGVKQFQQPYAALDNKALQRTRMFILKIKGAVVIQPAKPDDAEDDRLGTEIVRRHLPLSNVEEEAETVLLRGVPGPIIAIRRFGRLALKIGAVRATRIEPHEDLAVKRHDASKVAYVGTDGAVDYGEVVEFMAVETTHTVWTLALIREFLVTDRRPTFAVGDWKASYTLVEASDIKEIVGVLRSGSRYFVIKRKDWQADDEDLRLQNDDEQDRRARNESSDSDFMYTDSSDGSLGEDSDG